jgi:ribosome-associated toxin RatA of RatAB toxin-antitoxin module
MSSAASAFTGTARRAFARGRWPRARFLIALPGLVAAAGAAADEPDLEWIDRQALDSGAVLVQTDRDERPLTVHVRVATLVAARPEAIWRILIACEIAPEYVPNVTSCRSLERLNDGKAELFIQVVKPAFFLPTFEHVFRLDYEPYRRIDVHRVSGPIEHMEGSWWLLPQTDGRILLVYELVLDPGIPVPRFLVRATLKRDLPRLVEAVRERAQAQP